MIGDEYWAESDATPIAPQSFEVGALGMRHHARQFDVKV
jgi:hypothetical protein